MKDKEEQIIEKAIDILYDLDDFYKCLTREQLENTIKRGGYYDAVKLVKLGYRKLPEDSVVLSREEYEKLKSLYDTQKGAIMTSSIGDLPLTVEGLRKAVDEITRLNRVETELQEFNIKYYNEAKDLRRELKQARNETAEKILQPLYNACKEDTYGQVVVDFAILENLAKQFGVEIK